MKFFSDEAVEGFIADGTWTEETWISCFARSVEQYGDRECLVDAPNKEAFLGQTARRLTWSQLGAAVDRCTEVFYEKGIRRDDIVGIQIPNSVELIITYLALVKLGAILSPYHVAYRRHEIDQFVTITGTTVVITIAGYGSRDLLEDAAEVIQTREQGRLLVWHGSVDTPGEGIDLDDMLQGPHGARDVESYLAELRAEAGDCVAILFTSGTTGAPKGVPRCHGDSLASGTSTSAEARLSVDDVVLCPMPLVTGGAIAGMFLPWLIEGYSLVLHHPFSVEVFAGQIQDESVTYSVAPPAILTDMVSDGSMFSRYDLTSLRRIGSGSAALSGWMISRWETDHNVEVINFFGSTEGVQLFANVDTIPDPEHRGRNFPMPGSSLFVWRSAALAQGQVRLVDLETGGDILSPGMAGELRVKGPTLFSGYFGEARGGFDEQGFYCTGDLFELAAGQTDVLMLVGRIKDLIIRGGMNVSAVELEALITAHPQVAEVAAVGKMDARLGERTCLFVVPRDPADPPTLPQLIEFLQLERIATYKLPEQLEIIASLPRSAAGKVLKTDLRERINRKTPLWPMD